MHAYVKYQKLTYKITKLGEKNKNQNMNTKVNMI